MKKEATQIIIKSVIILLVILILALILGLPVQLLWNWLMPTIFNLPTITFWQAMGLNIMASILLKDNSIKNDK
jgi:ABC-type multidrug transport system permease subunit